MPRNRESEEFIKLKKWEESTKTLILARDYDPELQPFSISVVPDELRKWNENAYMPKVVTIGPHYKGATRDLQLMEEIKWDCMLFLFQRSKDQLEYPYNLEVQILNKWMKIILDLDVKVRASYVDEIKLDRYELGTTMLNDGCFLLALLINGSKELNEILESQIEGSKDRGVKLEEGLTDLILLENQIPLFILTRLATKIFPGVFVCNKDDHKEGSVYTIENLVLSFLGLSHDSSFNTILNDHAAHFLEIVYVHIFESELVFKVKKEEYIYH